MDAVTRRRLAALNRYFYSRFATAFADTRRAPWPGWRRLLAHLTPPPKGPLRVLDVGCGHGRFAAYCVAHFPGPVSWVGVDANSRLLALAEANLRGLASWRLLHRDVRRWPDRALPEEEFDLVVLLGLLHHLPGHETRRALLGAAASRLAPNGVMAFTVWRLDGDARLRRRVIPWEDFNARRRRPIDVRQLEEGDVLLAFGAYPAGVRYCHRPSDDEVAGWLEHLPPLCDDYLADGYGGQLNRYLVLRAVSA